jgi:hypothetical protein
MLKYIDTLDIFDQSITYPFLLLDGHHSRMMLPYLKYINDPSHKWYSPFGVPYATHIWQVADTSQWTLYLWLIWHFQKALVTGKCH